MKALTVRNPWALTIFMGKDIENRDWPTGYRGPLAIHASASMTRQEYEDAADTIAHLGVKPPSFEDCMATRGMVLGTVDMYGCVTNSESPWFFGKYGFQFRDQKRFEQPVRARGALGFWEFSAQEVNRG